MKNKSEILLSQINEIQKSIEHECYLSALALALTIPDICGKAEYPNAKGSKDRYVKWYDTYLGLYERCDSPYSADMPYLSGEMLYSLRCSVLHQGNPNVEGGNIHEDRCKVDEFTLVIDEDYDSGLSCVSYGAGMKIVHRKIEVNIVNICKKLCLTAEKYYN